MPVCDHISPHLEVGVHPEPEEAVHQRGPWQQFCAEKLCVAKCTSTNLHLHQPDPLVAGIGALFVPRNPVMGLPHCSLTSPPTACISVSKTYPNHSSCSVCLASLSSRSLHLVSLPAVCVSRLYSSIHPMHASCLPILRMPLASPPAACVVASLSTWCVKPTNDEVWQLGAVARLDAADLGEGDFVNEPLN